MIDGSELTGVESVLKFPHKTQPADVDLWKVFAKLFSHFFALTWFGYCLEVRKTGSSFTLFVFPSHRPCLQTITGLFIQ